jgi:hypothetical protein
MGTDGEGQASGDDCTEAEASAECSDMRGNCIFLFILFTMTRYRVFILRYEYPMSLFSLRIYKGNEKMGIRK